MGKYFSLCGIVSMVQQDAVVENSNATQQPTDQSVRSAQVSQQKIHAAALSIHETS